MLASGSGQCHSNLKQKSVYCTVCPKSLEPIANLFFSFRTLQNNASGLEDEHINNHSEINSVTHSKNRKLFKKFKEPGFVVDKSHLR